MADDPTTTDTVVLSTDDDTDDDQQHMHRDTSTSGDARPDTDPDEGYPR